MHEVETREYKRYYFNYWTALVITYSVVLEKSKTIIKKTIVEYSKQVP